MTPQDLQALYEMDLIDPDGYRPGTADPTEEEEPLWEMILEHAKRPGY